MHEAHVDEAVLEVDKCAVEHELCMREREMAYEDGAAEEGNEEMVVVDADAVHGERTVVVVAHTATIAHAAVVHPWKLEHLALVAVPPAGVPTVQRQL